VIGNDSGGGKEMVRGSGGIVHSKDMVQWWIWLGWRTWDEKWPGSRKGETGWWTSRAGWLDGEKFAKAGKTAKSCPSV